MRSPSPSNRDGFTMIELMVVITIIALMMALSVGALVGFISGAKEAATSTTIAKVNELIQDRVRGFRQFDFSEAGRRLSDTWNTNNPTDAVLTPELGEVLARKARFKQAFPQSYAEADRTRLFPSIPTTGWTTASPITFTPTPAGYDPKYECGIVLYALLTRGETFGAPSPTDDVFRSSELRVGPETNNLPCLVDTWGEPLRFYRWPTRLIRCGEQDFNGSGSYNDFNQNTSQDAAGVSATTGSSSILAVCPAIRPYASFPGSTPASLLMTNLPPFDRTSSYARGPDGYPGVAPVLPSPPGFDGDDDGINGPDDLGEIGWPDSDDPEPLNTDPDDPTFRLTAWFGDSLITPAALTTRRNGFVTQAHDFYTFHAPLVVSSGPDKLLGLYEPTDTTNFGHLAAPLPAASGLTYATSTMRYLSDNVTNLNQRPGGK